jgi:hypothetical protein
MGDFSSVDLMSGILAILEIDIEVDVWSRSVHWSAECVTRSMEA